MCEAELDVCYCVMRGLGTVDGCCGGLADVLA